LSDRKKVVSKQYGTKGFLFPSRKTFVIDKNGELKKIFNNVDVHNHAAEILKLFSKEN
jgi:peroxiredoxin Q/BCP